MEWDNKVWGRTRCLVEHEFFSQHELELEANTYCSFHYHLHRANRFIVKTGAVSIVCAYGWKIERHILTPGNLFEVPSLVPHQFQVIEAGSMVEEYWPDRGEKVWNGDIIRLSPGGKSVHQIKDLNGILFHSSLGGGTMAYNPGGPE